MEECYFYESCRLVAWTLLKVTILHEFFSRFLNCTNGAKSRNVSQMQSRNTACSYLAEINGIAIYVIAREDDPQQNIHINSKWEDYVITRSMSSILGNIEDEGFCNYYWKEIHGKRSFLWCFKRFYEGLKVLHKAFSGTTKNFKNKKIS